MAKELTVYEPEPESAQAGRQREAARIMYDALQRIARRDAFFQGEHDMKQIAVEALHRIELLSREGK